MRISVITAFPDLIKNYLSSSVLGRGIAQGRLEVSVVDIRDFAEGAYRQIDDYSFGGGGMVLMAEPLAKAVESVRTAEKSDGYVVFPSPQGVRIGQELVEDLASRAGESHLVIVCGHYEGADERFVRKFVDLEVSLGDFVITGGELPAMALVDAVARLVPGVVKSESVAEDSFYSGMLDNGHYTRPSVWRGEPVPDVLTGGDHRAINRHRRSDAAKRTLERRPDAVARAGIMQYMEHGVYVVLVHYPVLDRHGSKITTSITGMDLHDIARVCITYGVSRYIIATPLQVQRDMAKKIASHWTDGYGSSFNPDRADAFRLVRTASSVNHALDWVGKKEKKNPFVVATTAKRTASSRHWIALKREMLRMDRPVVLLFGTGSGLHDEVLESSDAVMAPIIGGAGTYNHLSVRNAVSIVLDRFFGWR